VQFFVVLRFAIAGATTQTLALCVSPLLYYSVVLDVGGADHNKDTTG